MVVLLILMAKSGGGARAGGKMMSSVLERLSLRKWCDIHADMSVSKLVMQEKIEGVR